MMRISDILRWFNIAAYVAKKDSQYTKYDLAEILMVSPSTIHRDLQAMRKMGIQIYSRKNKIQMKDNPEKNGMLLVLQIMAFEILNRQMEYKPVSKELLPILKQILDAIKTRQSIEIYHDHIWKEVTPLKLIPDQEGYCLLALWRDHPHRFLLSDIRQIRISQRLYCLNIVQTNPVQERRAYV